MSLWEHWPLVVSIAWVAFWIWAVLQTRNVLKPPPKDAVESPRRKAFRRLVKNQATLLGCAMMFVIALTCILGPWLMQVIWGYSYDHQDVMLSDLPPAWFAWFGYEATDFAPWTHFFGTDDLGRDTFVRVLEGGRISIAIGNVTAFLALIIGLPYGALAGYLGGRVDQLMMRFVDILYGLPYMVLVIVIMSLFGRNIWILFGAISMVAWLTIALITRDQVLRLKKEQFVEALEACGTPTWRIILSHLIPNSIGIVFIYAMLMVPRIMIEESALSFLGFGVRPPQSSWGTLISEGAPQLEYSPWLGTSAMFFLFVTVYALTYFGDGVRDALDPKVQSFRKGTLLRLLEILLGVAGGNKVADLMMGNEKEPEENPPDGILTVHGMQVIFRTNEGHTVHAINGVSFGVKPGECLAIVGESGSGKSVTVRTLMNLIPMPPGEITAGTSRFHYDIDLLHANPGIIREISGRRIAMIFQNAMSALNPYHTVGAQLMEVFTVHGRRVSRKDCIIMLRKVGIPDPESRFNEYPHQLSGGMQQRVMIAMAMLLSPEVLIADEPTTALDVTIQAQILDLMHRLKAGGTAIIFITHDLGVVAQIADRVAVMYAGKIVEQGTVEEVLTSPRHPYTQGLQQSVPTLANREPIQTIPGSAPDMRSRQSGCAFSPRCPLATGKCQEGFPQARRTSETHTYHCVQEGDVS